jgi:RNA polymerase sigma factor (sigma-70 family)
MAVETQHLTQQLCEMVRTAALGPVHDRELLERFVHHQDQAAFETLVRRHASLVLAACRRVLSDSADVEDVFQATFLVLMRQAPLTQWQDSIGPWLFGTAHRIAVQARASGLRRRQREAAASQQVSSAAVAPDPSWQEAVGILHEELNRLPDKFRLPLLLCYLNDLTRDEAAERLGVTAQAIKGRLERGRKVLRKRLVQRGVTLSAGLLGMLANSPTANGLPPRLIQATVRATTQGPSPAVAALSKGVSAAMLTSKSKLAVTVVLCLGLLTVLTGYQLFASRHGSASPGHAEAQPRQPEPARKPPVAAPSQQETVTIRGKALGPDEQPLAGASLHLQVSGKPEAEPRAVTGKEGLFQFQISKKVLAKNPMMIVRARGLAPDWFRLHPGGATERMARLVRDDVPITGQVVDLEGRPIAGALVRTGQVEARQGGGNLDPLVKHWKKFVGLRTLPNEALNPPIALKGIASEALELTGTRTDKEGRFRLTGFGRERIVQVGIEGKGLASTWLQVLTRPGAKDPPLPFYRYASVKVVLGPGKAIEGTIRERGSDRPAVGVTVTCGVGRTTTDEKGRFRINGLSKRERYFVGIRGTPYFFTYTEVADTPGLETITFDKEIDRGIVLQGKVIDQKTGHPIPARIQYIIRADNPHLKDYPDLSTQGTIPSSARARLEGTYRLPVIPGKGWLCVTAKDEERYAGADYEGDGLPILTGIPRGSHPSRFHAALPISIDPKDSGPITINVTLQPGEQREGKLVDRQGKPVSGVLAAGLRPISSMDGRFPQSKPLPGPTFTVKGLNARRKRPVVFYHLDKKLGKVVRLSAAQKDWTVVLDPMGGVSGRLLSANGKPIAGAVVTAGVPRRFKTYKDLPYELLHSHNKSLEVVVKTDGEGRFRLEGLIPELPYDVILSDRPIGRGTQYYAHREEVKVEAGKVVDLGDFKSLLPR